MSKPYFREGGRSPSPVPQYSRRNSESEYRFYGSASSGFGSPGSSSKHLGSSSPYPQYVATPMAKDSGDSDMADHGSEVKKAKKLPPIIRLLSNMGSCIAPSIKDENDETNFPNLGDISVQSSVSGYSRSSGMSTYSNDASLAPSATAITFTMAELSRATHNFASSHKIGQGGSGAVYKGKLRDGRIVAIKRSKKHSYEEELSAEFRNELVTLSNIEHMNLVRFIGYLDDASERILVVEYVSNGNLRQHLNGQFGKFLDFSTRLDIAIDVGHAITYLHMYAERPIIHRDIKSSNILLTENFRAKVADFGFSRLAPWETDATHVSTQVKGTAGYLDPEYLKTYKLSTKSDVYSFGIVLIELMTGRLPIEVRRPLTERITAKWAFQMVNEGRVWDVLDAKMERSPKVITMAERILVVGFNCAAPSKRERPSMRKATELLWNIRKDYKGTTLQAPPPAMAMAATT